jgi:tetratricopeptide (TPR) repeat protein
VTTARKGILAALAIVYMACLRRRVGAEPSPDASPTTESIGPKVSTREAFDNALRLAQSLHEDGVLARLRGSIASRPAATKADLEAMVAAFEAAGEPERAARILRERIARRLDAATSGPLLAELLTRAGRAREAAEAWHAVRAARGAAGLGPEEADAYARVLSRLGRFEQSFDVLAEARARAREEDTRFLSDLGALGWQLGHDVEAREAYDKLWRGGDRRDEIVHRLLVLSRAAGDAHTIVALAWEHFRTSHDAEMLLEVASQQLERGDFRALRMSLDLAEPFLPLFADHASYWTMRAECFAHEHALQEAARSWERAFALDPTSVTVEAELLWSALDAGGVARLRRVVARIEAAPTEAPVIREPLALAYRKLGRPRDAVRLWTKQRSTHPTLDATAFDLADALDGEGYAALAWRLAGAAAEANLSSASREEPLSASGADDPAGDPADDPAVIQRRQLRMRAAEVLGARRGPEQMARWLAATGVAVPRPPGRWVRWCLAQDSADCAGRVLAEPRGGDPTHEDGARRWSLARAIDDGDRTTMRDALAELPGEEPELRLRAALALDEPVTAPAEGPGDGAPRGAGAVGSDEPGDADEVLQARSRKEPDPWRAALGALRDAHAARARAGLSYEDLAELIAFGPDASGIIPVGDTRFELSLAARDLAAPSRTLRLKPYTTQADGLAVARLEAGGNLTELGAGASLGPFGQLPRGVLSHQRWLTPHALVTVRGAANEAIDDGALLHVAAAASQATTTTLLEGGPVYAELGAHLRDDRTRRWTELGREAGEDAELGVRLLRALPELDLGVRLHAQQRWNAARVPSELVPLLPLEATAGGRSRPLAGPYLPSTFQFAALAVHLVRGELGERHRPDGTPWPRYACGLEVGVRLPARDGAAGGQCALGLRLGSHGYLEASGAYGWGLVGLARLTSARASLSYALAF